jgi:hypothetical protein
VSTRILDRTAAPDTTPPRPAPPRSPHTRPDAGFDALPRLARLAADLAAAVAARDRSRWKEPPVFFFDAKRQAAFEAARPATPVADPLADLAARVNAELPALCASVDLRHVARAVDGLRGAAETLAPRCSAARDLADLLAVPDDEVVTVLHPALRLGMRLVVRGVADVAQFHVLLAGAAEEVLPGAQVPHRFVRAYRDTDPTSAAGVPMVAEARLQMYAPAALRSDGTLPLGFGGSDHWLWPNAPLASVPRIDGERVVLLGPPPYRATWEVSRRFPALPAEVQLADVLSPFRVAERLSNLAGRPVPVTLPAESKPRLAKAA